MQREACTRRLDAAVHGAPGSTAPAAARGQLVLARRPARTTRSGNSSTRDSAGLGVPSGASRTSSAATKPPSCSVSSPSAPRRSSVSSTTSTTGWGRSESLAVAAGATSSSAPTALTSDAGHRGGDRSGDGWYAPCCCAWPRGALRKHVVAPRGRICSAPCSGAQRSGLALGWRPVLTPAPARLTLDLPEAHFRFPPCQPRSRRARRPSAGVSHPLSAAAS